MGKLPDYETVKALYTILVKREIGDDENGVCNRVLMVRELEQITGKQFRNTAEFHREVSAFLARKSRVSETMGTRIRRARRKAKLTIKNLAGELGVAKRTVIRWERNEAPPSTRGLEWLNKTLLEASGRPISENEPYGEKVTLERLRLPEHGNAVFAVNHQGKGDMKSPLE